MQKTLDTTSLCKCDRVVASAPEQQQQREVYDEECNENEAIDDKENDGNEVEGRR